MHHIAVILIEGRPKGFLFAIAASRQYVVVGIVQRQIFVKLLLYPNTDTK